MYWSIIDRQHCVSFTCISLGFWKKTGLTSSTPFNWTVPPGNLYPFLRDAVTKYHKPEVWKQGVSGAMLPLKHVEENPFLPLLVGVSWLSPPPAPPLSAAWESPADPSSSMVFSSVQLIWPITKESQFLPPVLPLNLAYNTDIVLVTWYHNDFISTESQNSRW